MTRKTGPLLLSANGLWMDYIVQTAQYEYGGELRRIIWTRVLVPSGASWSCGTAAGLCPNGLAALPSESSEKVSAMQLIFISHIFHMFLIVLHWNCYQMAQKKTNYRCRSAPQGPTLRRPSGAPSRRPTAPRPAARQSGPRPAARQSGTCRWSCGKSLRSWMGIKE